MKFNLKKFHNKKIAIYGTNYENYKDFLTQTILLDYKVLPKWIGMTIHEDYKCVCFIVSSTILQNDYFITAIEITEAIERGYNLVCMDDIKFENPKFQFRKSDFEAEGFGIVCESHDEDIALRYILSDMGYEWYGSGKSLRCPCVNMPGESPSSYVYCYRNLENDVSGIKRHKINERTREIMPILYFSELKFYKEYEEEV